MSKNRNHPAPAFLKMPTGMIPENGGAGSETWRSVVYTRTRFLRINRDFANFAFLIPAQVFLSAFYCFHFSLPGLFITSKFIILRQGPKERLGMAPDVNARPAKQSAGRVSAKPTAI
jgi:hypothetical protein